MKNKEDRQVQINIVAPTKPAEREALLAELHAQGHKPIFVFGCPQGEFHVKGWQRELDHVKKTVLRARGKNTKIAANRTVEIWEKGIEKSKAKPAKKARR